MELVAWLKLQWDRATAWVLIAVGAVALLLGWIGVSGHAFLADQLPYLISGGIGGLFILGVGAVLWLSADLRDEWYKLDRIERALLGEFPAEQSEVRETPAVDPMTDTSVIVDDSVRRDGPRPYATADDAR